MERNEMRYYKRIGGVSHINYGHPMQSKEKVKQIVKELRANNPNVSFRVVKEKNGSTAGQYQIYMAEK